MSSFLFRCASVCVSMAPQWMRRTAVLWASQQGHVRAFSLWLPGCWLQRDLQQQSSVDRDLGVVVYDCVLRHLKNNPTTGPQLARAFLQARPNIAYDRAHPVATCRTLLLSEHGRLCEDMVLLVGPMAVSRATLLFSNMIDPQKQDDASAERYRLRKLDFLARHKVDPLLPYKMMFAQEHGPFFVPSNLTDASLWTSAISTESMSVLSALLDACATPPTPQQCRYLFLRDASLGIDSTFVAALEKKGVRMEDVMRHFASDPLQSDDEVMNDIHTMHPQLYGATIEARQLIACEQQRTALHNVLLVPQSKSEKKSCVSLSDNIDTAVNIGRRRKI